MTIDKAFDVVMERLSKHNSEENWLISAGYDNINDKIIVYIDTTTDSLGSIIDIISEMEEMYDIEIQIKPSGKFFPC